MGAVWQTSSDLYVDSKYRTYECDASADRVVIAWQMADPSGRQDIEAALEFFPYGGGIRSICHFLVALSGFETGQRVEARWFDGDLRPETVAFLKEALSRSQGAPRIIVCDTPWFTASWDGFSYYYELEGKLSSVPGYEDFCREYSKANSRLYRDVLTKFWGFPRES